MTKAITQRDEATRWGNTGLLHVERSDINWRNVASGHVLIDIRVHNDDGAASAPTFLTLQAAPFGAFLPWREMVKIPVPSIEPLSAVEVNALLPAPQTQPIGDFSDVPPRGLLIALADDDEPSRYGARNDDISRTVNVNSFRPPGPPVPQTKLPDDPFLLLSRPNMHWVGNISVLIEDQFVERHQAQALRMYPGRPNLAMFYVGADRDEYKFDLVGNGAEWDAALYDITESPTLSAPSRSGSLVPQSQWVTADPTLMVMLNVCPPEFCESGEIEIHILQLSTGREAVVEFKLDAHAAGEGCFAV